MLYVFKKFENSNKKEMLLGFLGEFVVFCCYFSPLLVVVVLFLLMHFLNLLIFILF